ncbi:hypothetical protein B0H11DRAFT_1952256 [Mycena galericulata]|nr:hypothetical protein B0H11DRAFT_1952256 [Mycena galericulata]
MKGQGQGRQQQQHASPPPPPVHKKSRAKVEAKVGAKASGHQRAGWDSDPSESASQSEVEGEADGEAEVEREATVVRRPGTGPRAVAAGAGAGAGAGKKAKSEVGHGMQQRRTESSLGLVYGGGASGAGSAVKRLSHPHLPSAPLQHHQQPPQKKPPVFSASASDSDSSSDSESEVDSDDAPLATLVAPRRPGSALSHASRGSSVNLNASANVVNLGPGSRANLHAAGSHSNLALAGSGSHSQAHLPVSPLQSHAPPTPTPSAIAAQNKAHAPRSASQNRSASPTSSAGSRAPQKPKPLIDIAALTAARPTLFSQKEKDREGFTGGGMLAAVGAAGSASGSNAASPVLTSRSPPVSSTGSTSGFVHFPSPPGSPVAETPPVLGKGVVEVGKKKSPMRRETGGAVVSLGALNAPPIRAASPPGKRDVLSERLRAVAAANASAQKDNKDKDKAGGARVVEREKEKEKTPPPPAFASVAARKMFHRRSSSDIISSRAPMWSDGDAEKERDAEDGALGRDLADMLGGGIALVSRTGELSPPRVGSLDGLAAMGGDWEERGRAGVSAEEQGQLERERAVREKDSIAPIVIKQRSPPPAFSVTSRPAHAQSRSVSAYGDLGVRQRSSTLVPVSTASASAASSFGGSNRSGTSNANSNSNSSNSNSTPNNSNSNSHANSAATSTSSGSVAGDVRSSGSSTVRTRPRSSTMMPLVTAPAPSASPPTGISPLNNPPARPFAAPRMERNSPASSTGDSSSGPAPLTPRDGSDFGSGASRGSAPQEEAWSGGVSGLVPVGATGRRIAAQRRSVSFDFDEDLAGDGKGKAKAKAKPRETPVQEEERRRERRRSEARAAIELGNVINGRGPIADDDDEDDEDDVPVNQARLNPMITGTMGMGMNLPMNNMQMGMNMPMNFASPGGMSPAWSGWQGQSPPGMLSPQQFMVPPPADPSFYAAHQQAMMYAKQAYQMAVAQQAMAVAADEWERGSSIGGAGGFGGRGSVYGGSSVGPSPSAMGSPFGMGMGMGMQGGWSPGGGMFPPAPRSMYGGGARSEYGGGGGGGNGGGWSSSRSVYGETFGPSTTERYSRTTSSGNLAAQPKNTRAESGYFPPVPAMPQGQSGRPGPSPRQRTASQPASPSRIAAANAARRNPPPPSSWKAAAP